MLSNGNQINLSVPALHLQHGSKWGWQSLKWLGGALIILTVPGGLVVWLGREALKRGISSTESGLLWTGSNWINRKLPWVLNPIQKGAREGT